METLEKQLVWVKCLGWCNEKFESEDKFRNRFCKQCAAKKEQIERSSSGIRISDIDAE